MEKVEVDPKLFVTCRLCLEDMGMYQIIPTIQQKIKYCFDIDVAPFDGLPQLICKKCEGTLCDYYAIKTAYVEKQIFLINSLQNKQVKNEAPLLPKIAAFISPVGKAEKLKEDVTQQSEKADTSSSDNKSEQEKNIEVKASQKSVKKKRRRISSSSDSSDDKGSEGSKVKPLIIKKSNTRIRRRWHTADYNKYFTCRVCNKSYVKKDYFFKHYTNIHSSCLKKYSSILNTICTVSIEKLDKKPNFTGVHNTVVLSKDRVVVNDENSKYYILYTSRNQNNSSNDIQTKTNNESSDSSDNAKYSVSRKRRKQSLRLLSTDTVVIEKKDDNGKVSDTEGHLRSGFNNSSKSDIITECITLDSDSETDNTLETGDSKLEEPIGNRLIRNIIDVCHSKYIRNIAFEKKKKPNYADIESQLKHKVLNLGRKIINKQGLNCTGLLRYLEYRNLSVIWLPKTCHTFNGPPVRISMTTLKKDHQRPEDSDVGWTDVPFTSNIFSIDNNLNENLALSKESTKKDVNSQINNICNDVVTKENNINLIQNKVIATYSQSSVSNVSQEQVPVWEPMSEQACLYKCEESSSGGKLLNKNPVANPKQLPKKATHYEIKPNKHILDHEIEIDLQSAIDKQPSLLSDTSTDIDDLTCMPIITSTTSLASEYQAEKESKKENNRELINKEPVIRSPTASMPRIKVKPVSELMPENVSTPNSLLINQNNIGRYDPSVPNMTQFMQQMQPQNIVQPVSVVQMPDRAANEIPDNQKPNSEYVILDTVEMPNSKTMCPFIYLKSLLAVHNLVLMEKMNTQDFQCLIKFKVLFKQESFEPIVLCLSLHCYSNRFFIGLKDSSHVNIDMQKISANWQWEIIKIFQGDVSNKIIQTALKMGLEVHDYSKKFLCILKTIQMKKIEV